MSDFIFANEAPRYWAAGRRVIPLLSASKRPAFEKWTGHLSAVPNEISQQKLLQEYAACGVGLLTGEEVEPGIILAALDADDDRLRNPLLQFLSTNRAGRQSILSGKRGKKGETFFVRVKKEKGVKSTSLQGAGGLGNIDFLAGGRMTVLPPSIHPDTNLPYEWTGTPLLDVAIGDLPLLGEEDIKALSITIGFEDILTIMGGVNTHGAVLALSNRLVAGGLSDETIIAIITAFLPEGYDGNTLDELPGMIESAHEKGFGQTQPKGRDNQIGTLIDLALSQGAELFNDGYGGGFITVPTAEGRATYSLPSSSMKLWLRHWAATVLGKHIGSNPIVESMQALEARALMEAPTLPIFRRVGGDQNRVEIDLGRRDGTVVAITRNGWKVEPTSEFRFLRPPGMGMLPEPVRGGDLRRLQKLQGLDDTLFQLVLAFMLNALKPSGPYFVLLVEGEQGSGKSFLTQVIKRIVDPNRSERTRLPDKELDLMIQAKEFWLLNFDNASGMKADISDALCSLATGGGIAVRKLYTDGELNVLSYARPFVINGISNFVNRPDLMERAIPLRLPPLPEGSRKEEAVMWAEFETMLPGILGVLYDAVAASLRRRDEVTPPTNLRMADAARWILAGETAFGFEGASVVDVVAGAQDALFVERVNDDPLTIKLRGLAMRGSVYEGRIGDLFATLELGQNPTLPRTPMHLSRALDRLRPALVRAGIQVEFQTKGRDGRKVRITQEPKGPPPNVKF